MEELTTADSIPAAETSLVHRLSQLAGEGLSAGLAQGTESDDEIDVDVYEKLDFSGIEKRRVALLKLQLQELIKRQLQKARRHLLVRDKLSFVLGVLGAILCAWSLGAAPNEFYKVYTVAAVVLFTLRLIVYRWRKWHYYLFDFCYFVNCLLLVRLWLLPQSAFLHKVTFAYAAGPLAWSVVGFRNSLVFHSLDKITSLFLHWFPLLVVWTERWHMRKSRRGTDARDWETASLAQLVFLPMGPYLLWAMMYYIKVFVISSAKINQKRYSTLFSYMMSNPKSLIAKMVSSVPPQWQPLAYMSIHINMTAATFALSKVWWCSFHAHSVFLLFLLTMSAWNGATYYFQFFAVRYVSALKEIQSKTQ